MEGAAGCKCLLERPSAASQEEERGAERTKIGRLPPPAPRARDTRALCCHEGPAFRRAAMVTVVVRGEVLRQLGPATYLTWPKFGSPTPFTLTNLVHLEPWTASRHQLSCEMHTQWAALHGRIAFPPKSIGTQPGKKREAWNPRPLPAARHRVGLRCGAPRRQQQQQR